MSGTARRGSKCQELLGSDLVAPVTGRVSTRQCYWLNSKHFQKFPCQIAEKYTVLVIWCHNLKICFVIDICV